ncbi:MAG TPA: hypothetical protein VKQ34_02465 [Candidatus Saccharimonadales bacterium]|nr:hypothetical protein [Candidatus Saccharimonadales bacterium]
MVRIAIKATVKLLSVCSIVIIGLNVWPSSPAVVSAGQLAPRSLTMSDGLAAAHNVTYEVSMGIATSGTLGSIRIQLCSNTSLIDDPCVAPFGFDASGATLTTQTGATGFVISTDSTSNEIILTRPPAVQAPVTATYTFTNVTNPSNSGTFYARLLTYASSDATGPDTDDGGLAMATDPSLAISTEVPPFLKFCLGESITDFDCTTATEPFSDLGELSPTLTSAAQSQMVVATNASNGYTISSNGTTMTSGNNTITAMNGGTSQKGTPQFGLNLVANTNPGIGQDPLGPGSGVALAGYNQTNHFRFTTGDALASSGVPEDFRKYTVSYIVNIPQNQPGGVYSTTLTYVCLANF